MEMNKIINKEEKQEDIIILDEGINTNNSIEILGYCCPIIFILFRLW